MALLLFLTDAGILLVGHGRLLRPYPYCGSVVCGSKRGSRQAVLVA